MNKWIKRCLIVCLILIPVALYAAGDPNSTMERLIGLFRAYHITTVPDSLPQSEFENKIINKIGKQSRKSFFQSFYTLKDGNYTLTKNPSSSELKKMINTLHVAGYHKISKEKEAENEVTKRKIAAIFDFDTLMQATAIDLWEKLSTEQQTNFISKFKSIIEMIAYPQGSYFYSNSENDFKAPVLKDGRAYVASDNYNKDKDIEITITYVLQEKKGNWALVDIEMNGHSLIEAYRLQINRIVKKKGIEGFLKVIDDKYTELSE